MDVLPSLNRTKVNNTASFMQQCLFKYEHCTVVSNLVCLQDIYRQADATEMNISLNIRAYQWGVVKHLHAHQRKEVTQLI